MAQLIDELVAGLDPLSREALSAFGKSWRNSGKTLSVRASMAPLGSARLYALRLLSAVHLVKKGKRAGRRRRRIREYYRLTELGCQVYDAILEVDKVMDVLKPATTYLPKGTVIPRVSGRKCHPSAVGFTYFTERLGIPIFHNYAIRKDAPPKSDIVPAHGHLLKELG